MSIKIHRKWKVATYVVMYENGFYAGEFGDNYFDYNAMHFISVEEAETRAKKSTMGYTVLKASLTFEQENGEV